MLLHIHTDFERHPYTMVQSSFNACRLQACFVDRANDVFCNNLVAHVGKLLFIKVTGEIVEASRERIRKGKEKKRRSMYCRVIQGELQSLFDLLIDEICCASSIDLNGVSTGLPMR